MTMILLLGYIPLMLLVLAVSLYASGQRRDSQAARELGEMIGRRNGLDRRADTGLPFVGNDRRTGVDRRGAQLGSGRADRAA